MIPRVLLDTDFLVSYAISNESTHSRAKKLFSLIESYEWSMLTVIKYELATVLSRKLEHGLACRIFQEIISYPIAVISTEKHEEDAWKAFYAQTRKNISFADCANLVVARTYGFKIASFDEFYPDELSAENFL